MLKNKNIVIGVCGGIAAYKACEIVSALKKMSANVDVIMTANACRFVAPLTFESLSNNPVTTDMFVREREWEIEHIALAKKADCFLVVPATANIVGKLANGIADDMLSTTLMATKAPVLIAPAMNSNMYNNTAYVTNEQILRKRGYCIIEPTQGRLACGDVGNGKLANVDDIIDVVKKTLLPRQDLAGKKVLITAGATIEKIDAVRYITNFSSGKMGVCLAEECLARGADVLLIMGKHSVDLPKYAKTVQVDTTQQMLDAVMTALPEYDIVIKAAAPCDYKIEHYADTKHKEASLSLNLVKNPDIAKEVGKQKGDKTLVVFSAETEDLERNAFAKLQSKNADLVVANNILTEGAGFGTDTNIVTLIDKSGVSHSLPKLTKRQVATAIIDAICNK